MAELNKTNCLITKSNTGTGNCPLDLKKIIGSIELPRGRVLTKAELATLKTTLSALILAAPGDRIYPIGPFDAVTDNTEDPTFQTLGYGLQVPVRDGNYSWTFQYTKGGLCLSNKLRSRVNSYGDFLYFDDQNILFGTKGIDADGADGLAGVPISVFYPYPWKANDGSNVTAYRLRTDFKPEFVNEYIAYVQADFPLSTLVGLQNINLEVAAGPATGVVQIKALTGCGGENLYDLYSTELAAAALWQAYRADTGAVLTITSVAVNAGIKAFTVTLDVTDTDYVALTAAGKVKLGLVAPTALAAADIVGYDGIPVEYVRGA
jgi:hypothetical protein